MRYVLVLLPLFLAGCLGAGDPPKYGINPVATASPKIRTSAKTILISKVSLPSYAAESRITVQNETGALVGLPDADWADDPERAMTYALVRHLSEISGRKVAADPWPLDGLPDAEIRVRVEEMVVDKDGTLNLSGQFAVRRDDVPARNRIKTFALRTPAKSTLPLDVLSAHDRAWERLAVLIAKDV